MKRKIGTWFQLLVLLLGVLFPALANVSRVQAAMTDANVITALRVTDNAGNTATNASIWENFRVYADFSLQNNSVNEGDTTVIKLPNELALTNKTPFELKHNGQVVANAVLDDVAKTVTLTYTNYVDTHSDVTGNFFFYVRVDHEVIQDEQDINLDFNVNGTPKSAGQLHFVGVPKQYDSKIEKSGWSGSDPNTISYNIAINRNMQEFKNVTIRDTLSAKNPGVHIDPSTLKIYKVGWFWKNGDWGRSFTEDVTSQFTVNYSDENRHFTVDLGDISNQEGYLIDYSVRTDYEPVDGEMFTNDSALVSNDAVLDTSQSNVQYLRAGGDAEGYVFNIKIHKKNEAGQALQGAEFEVVRDRTNTVVGTLTTDVDGNASVGNLLKDNYTIRETKAPAGYEKSTEEIKISPQDFGADKSASREVINKQISQAKPVTFSKASLAGDEIAGAQIKIYKGETATGTAVEEWTSEAGKSKNLTLEPGKYTFHEEAAPNGYLKVTDFVFEVKADGSVAVISAGEKDAKGESNQVVVNGSTITVTDKDDDLPRKVTFSKVNLGGEEIAGAQIKIYKGETATGTAVEEWTSEAGKSKELNLEPGKYTFHEEAAPNGYTAVTDITFQVNYDGSVTVLNANSNAVEYKDGKLVITDQYDLSAKKVTFSKVNLGGEEIAGAQIKIYKGETATGSPVQEWTSEAGKSKELNLEPGKYTFHEEAAPNGYTAVTDITFQVNYDGSVTVLNANSNAVEYKDGKLVITDQYDLSAKKVTFSKVNLAGEEIAGAQIKIYKGETATGTAVEEWTSEAGKSKELDLEPGKYTFHEEAAPNGYTAVTDITFQVNYDGSVTVFNANSNAVEYKDGKLVITDQYDLSAKKVTFSKVNLAGEEIAGAQIKIYKGETATGSPVQEWTSEAGKSKELNLEPGKYTFHEEAAPTGYLAVTDFTFQVNYDGTVTILQAANGTVEYKDGKLVVTDQADPNRPNDEKPNNPNNPKEEQPKDPNDPKQEQPRDPADPSGRGQSKKVLPSTGSQISIGLSLLGLVLILAVGLFSRFPQKK